MIFSTMRRNFQLGNTPVRIKVMFCHVKYYFILLYMISQYLILLFDALAKKRTGTASMDLEGETHRKSFALIMKNKAKKIPEMLLN